LATYTCKRHRHAGHAHHLFQSLESIARAIGMDRGHRSFVASVHRLQHVECLFAATFADDDAIRPHTKRVPHEIALANFSPTFSINRSSFHTANVRLL